jgi:hypothetical protein
VTLTFSFDDLFVFGVVRPEEGNGLARIECLLQFIVNLPAVITFFN